MKNLKDKAISGVFWSAFTQFFRQSFSFLTTIFLVRLLAPQDFGLLGMVTVFTGFASIFIDVGFGSALIQKKTNSQLDLSSVFWFNVATGCLLTLLFIALAPSIAHFYNEPLLRPLTMLMAFNFVFGSFGIVQKTLLLKKINFKSPFKIQLYVQPATTLITLILAWMGYGVWAIALQVVLNTLLTTIALWYISAWRPSFAFSWLSLKAMFGFSINLLGNDTLNYWVRNADNLLVGKFIGTSALGIYSKSYGILTLPLRNISRVISRVLFPSLSHIQEQKEKVKAAYLKVIRMISLFTFPLMAGLFSVADRFIPTVYGQQWSAMIPLVKVFCILGVFQSIGHVVSNLYLSQGRTDLMFRVGTGLRILLISAIIIGLQWGVMGVAVCYTATSIIANYVDHYYAGKLVKLSYMEICNNLKGVFFSSLVMGIVVNFSALLLQLYFNDITILILQVLTGAVTYFMLLHTFKIEAYQHLRILLHERMQKRKLKKVKPVV